MASHPTAGVPQAAVGYFVDQKKGEVNELKQVQEVERYIHQGICLRFDY